MGKWYKGLLCTVLCAVLMIPAVRLQAQEIVFAEAETAEIQRPYAAEGVLVLDGFADEGEDGWIPATGVSSVRVSRREGISLLQAVPADAGGEYAIMRNYPAGAEPNLMGMSKLTVQIMVPGDTDTVRRVSIRMYSGLNVWTAEAEITTGSWHTVSADIGEWKYRTSINMMEITVHNEGMYGGFTLGGIYAHGDADLSLAEQFMTFGYTAENGSAEYRDGVYILDAGDDGNLTLIADAVRPSYATKKGVCALRVVLDQALSGGYISLSVSDGAASLGSFTIASTCPVYYGENTYLLPFDETIPLRAYRLSFRGLYADGREGVVLREVSFVCFDEKADAGVGKITECAFFDGMGTLSVRGTLPNEVVTSYIDGTIGLFEIPVWMDEAQALSEGEPLQTIRISTKFRFQVDMYGRKNYSSASRYVAAILTEEGIIPIGEPCFPTHPTAEKGDRNLSIVGLCGTDAADAFEANASAVIVDVDISRLLCAEENASGGQLYVRGGTYYYFDTSYIRQLDAEIDFCLAADMEVYLRLCGMDARSILGEGIVPDAARVQTLCAVTEYVAARYPLVCGFIAGYRMDETDGPDTDVAEYAAQCAVFMRLIYNSAVEYIPHVSVIAPLGNFAGDREAAEGRYCDPVLFAVHLSRAIEADGDMRWAWMGISDLSAQTIVYMQNILSQIKAVGQTTTRKYLLVWEPHGEYISDILLEEYSDRCQSAMKAGAQVLFLSLSHQKDPATLCAGLKHISIDGASGRQLSVYSAMLVGEPVGYSGKYVWGDFSRSYSTLGWMAGSGCDRLATQAGSLASGERALHAVFGGEDMFSPVQGNILRANGMTEDMRYAPYVIYTLQVVTEVEAAGTAELVFVFGSGDTRAEYRTVVSTGRPVRILCDLTEFPAASEVNFTAIALQCDSAASLDIQKIECFSGTYSDAELAEIYRYRDTGYALSGESGVKEMSRVQWAVCILIGMGTVTAFALLSRREKERE